MFIKQQNESDVQEYVELLRIMASLSNLFSENTKPYLDYRVTENIFCMCFNAKNLSRSDCTADASKNGLGIGIKTFLNTASNSSMQKIAEFNRQRKEYANLDVKELINSVATFRNDRIEVTKRMHDLEDIIYHCTIRDNGVINVIETPMPIISIDKIKINQKAKDKNVIYFEDGINEYSFNISKSVLYKRFEKANPLLIINVNIVDNPYLLLKELFNNMKYSSKLKPQPIIQEKPHIFLPLYSISDGKRYVPESSGLNQWNAKGRKRNENELYIPTPIGVYRSNPGFFPPRGNSFNLMLPNGIILSAKMCQEGSKTDNTIGKGLMSNPNSALGKWLLRHVLQLKEGVLVTYEMLENLGIDSVVIYKEDEENFSIDFTSSGKYEELNNDTI